ncbi:hypothetical protein F5Y04DRAFT_261221 [Hypomontagnella monticulosa]|nr:hypothetical protein F5Y04DRAFT_261221 [Hypomontagnella monticulosa]
MTIGVAEGGVAKRAALALCLPTTWAIFPSTKLSWWPDAVQEKLGWPTVKPVKAVRSNIYNSAARILERDDQV